MSTTRTDRVWLDAFPNKTIGLTGLQSQGVNIVAGEYSGLHVQRAAERLGRLPNGVVSKRRCWLDEARSMIERRSMPVLPS